MIPDISAHYKWVGDTVMVGEYKKWMFQKVKVFKILKTSPFTASWKQKSRSGISGTSGISIWDERVFATISEFFCSKNCLAFPLSALYY